MKDDTSLILECPGCETRYEIPVALPDTGRKVRCAKCAHVWIAQAGDEIRPGGLPAYDDPRGDDEIVFRDGKPVAETATAGEPGPEPESGMAEEPEPEAGPETDEFARAMAEPAVGEDEQPADAAMEAESAQDHEDAPAGPDGEDAGDEHDIVAEFYGEQGPEDDGETEREAPGAEPDTIVIGKARRRTGFSASVAAAWLALCIVVGGLGYLAVQQRIAVVKALPGSAWIYARLGLPVNVRGLDFRDVAYSWETDEGRVVLEVHGDIVNITPAALEVPRVVFALRDSASSEVYQWEDQVVRDPLAGGEKATFAVRIPTPPKSIKSVQVRFAGAR